MISDKPLRVNLFRLQTGDKSADLEDVLKLIYSHPLEHRTRKVGYQQYRLETIERPGGGHPYWLLDFCKLRYDDGPGRASPNRPTKSFDLDADEGFAEETGVLFDPESNYMAIQYNHHGPRSGVIANYVSIYDTTQPNDFGFLLQLNPEAQARLDGKTIFTRLQIKVAPGSLSKAYKKRNVSIVSALEMTQEQYGSDWVSVTVGLEPKSPASLRMRKLIDGFKAMATDERHAVETLVISGRNEAGDRIDEVDLISEKLEFAYKDIELDSGRRMTWESRRSALIRSYNGWRKAGLIRKK